MVHGIGSFPEAGKVQGNELLAGNGRTGGVVPTVKDILNYLSGIKEGK